MFRSGFLATLAQLCISNEAPPAGRGGWAAGVAWRGGAYL